VDSRSGGDLDDFLGPLRQGNPLGAGAARNPVMRGAVVAGSLAASIFTFQAMFAIQAFTELRSYGQREPGPSHENRKENDESILRGALITAIHLCFGLACLGPLGYLAFSMTMSGALQIFAAGFHQPSGVGSYGRRHYYDRQLESATNLKMPENALIQLLFKYLLFGGGGNHHIEHHLWENVPIIHLHKLAPEAKAYCKLHGLEYHEVTFMEAWCAWLGEAWRLSGLAPGEQSSAVHAERC